MTATPKKLVAGSQLTASAATYYTAAANTKTLLKKLTFTNNDTTARTVTVYLVPSGGTAGVTNLLTKAASIAAGATYEAFEAEGHILAPGDTLQALADVTSMVTIQASGVEIV
jgi:hypothetical protein